MSRYVGHVFMLSLIRLVALYRPPVDLEAWI